MLDATKQCACCNTNGNNHDSLRHSAQLRLHYKHHSSLRRERIDALAAAKAHRAKQKQRNDSPTTTVTQNINRIKMNRNRKTVPKNEMELPSIKYTSPSRHVGRTDRYGIAYRLNEWRCSRRRFSACTRKSTIVSNFGANSQQREIEHTAPSHGESTCSNLHPEAAPRAKDLQI